MPKAKTILKKSGRVLLFTVLGLVALLVLVYFFLATGPGKRTVRNQVENYLQDKLKTKVSIGSVDYSLPNWLELKDVYFEDQNNDTLFFGKELSVDLNMIKLAMGNTDIQKVYLNNIYANIRRKESDRNFNFQYIVDAFTGNKSSTTIKDTAELKITLSKLIADTLVLNFDDRLLGNKFYSRISNLNTTLNKFQPDRLNFGIDNFDIKGVVFDMFSYKEKLADTTQKIISDSAKAEATYGVYIKAKRASIQDAYVNIEDSITNMRYMNNVRNLSFANLLYSHEQSIATADTAKLDSALVKFVQPIKKSKVVKNASVTESDSPPLLVKAGWLYINETAVQYDDLNKPKQAGFDASHINMQGLKADIVALHYSKDSTSAFLKQLAFRDSSGLRIDSATADFIFTDTALTANTFYLRTPQSQVQSIFKLRYDSVAGIAKYPTNSLLEAKFSNSIIAFNDLYNLLPFLRKSFPPSEFGGNKLRINTELRGTLQRLYLPYLTLQGLSGSELAARGTLFNLTNSKNFRYDLYIISSKVLKKDLMKFVPPANRQSLANLPDVFQLQGQLTGDANALAANVKATSKDINFAGLVTLKNIQNPAKLTYDLNFDQVKLSDRLIYSYIPPDVRNTIELPSTINAKGKFNGNKNDFDADLKLQTSFGNGDLKGFMRGFSNPKTAKYDLSFNTSGFDLGRVLKQDTSIGYISGFVSAKGTGFDYKTMNADIVAKLNSIQYNKYNYQNVNATAQFRNGVISSQGNINDPNLRTSFDIVANVNREYPTITGVVDIDTVQLRALGFTSDTINLSTRVYLQARNTTPRALDVDVFTDTTFMQTSTQRFVIDTMSLVGTSQNGVDDIQFKSPFGYAAANGAFDYDKVGNSLAQYINGYYHFTDTKVMQNALPQQINFDAYVVRHPIVLALVTGLQDYDSLKFSGSYASDLGDSALNIKATVPHLLYNGNSVRYGELVVNAKDQQLNYDVVFDTVQAGGRKFFGSHIFGSAAKDSIAFNAITQDQYARDWFGAKADIYLDADKNFNLKLNDDLLLNYEKWNVEPGNFISYGKKGVLVQNFNISNDTSAIEINSKEPIYNSPLVVNVDNFNLKSITSFLNADTLLFGGIMDAQLEVSEFEKNLPAFTGTAQITDLEFKQTPLGTLALFTQRSDENTVTGRANLNGSGNLINASGNVYLNNPDRQFDADLDILNLNFLTLQGFTFGQLKNASGNLHGKVNLNGKFAEPKWFGSLVFDTVRFTPTQLGAPYNITNQSIVLNYPKIQFNNFSVRDSVDHYMSVYGNITATSLTAYKMDLNISADNFIFMNIKKPVAETLYGLAYVDANIHVGGNTEVPDIDGIIRINERSDIKLVLPDRNYIKDEGLSVVKFIDRDTFDIYHPPTFSEAPSPKINFARFLDYNLNVDVAKDAQLTIIIDPSTGDELKVKGTALLNAGVDPGGNLVLGGTYVLEEGSYELSYQFIQRKFDLKKGSTLTFAGPPMEAQADISAVYHVNTSTKDLLGSQITNSTTTMSGMLNQRVPFNVNLFIKGIISKPEIKFGIDLVEEGTDLISNELRTTIDNKLAQMNEDEAAMNKQVFSLLLLGRFVNGQSSDFFAGSGGGLSDIARQSVTQFLSEALDEIAADMIRGVDIDLSLNSYKDFSMDNTGVQRTDLNVSLSKSFLDDRLTVSIGQNFGIEGQDAVSKANTRNNNNAFNPNISATYKLTSDGRYLLRGYRKNQFEVVLDGYVVETGLSFIVVMDYEKFRQIFSRKKIK